MARKTKDEKSTSILDILEKSYQEKIADKRPPEEIVDIFFRIIGIYYAQSNKDKYINIIKEYLDYVISFYGENSHEAFNVMCMLAFSYFHFQEKELFTDTIHRVSKVATAIGGDREFQYFLESIGAELISNLDLEEEPQFPDSKEEIEEMLSESLEKNGKNNLQHISLIQRIVFNYITLGEPDSAIELLEREIDERNSNNSQERFVLSVLYNELSMCHEYINDFDTAIEYKEAVLEIRENDLGWDKKSYKADFLDYLNLLNIANENEKAVDKAREMLLLNTKKHGKNDPYSSELRGSIALSLLLLDRRKEALDIARENYEINADSFGETSQQAIFAEKELANIYSSNGEYKKAIILFKDVRKKGRAYYSLDSDFLLEVKLKLTEIYIAIGDGRNALKEATMLVKYLDRKEGKDSENSLNAHYLLGCAYRENSEYDKALSELESIYNKQIYLFDDPENEDALLSLLAIGTVYDGKGEKDKANTTFNEVLESALRTLGPDSSLALEASSLLELYN